MPSSPTEYTGIQLYLPTSDTSAMWTDIGKTTNPTQADPVRVVDDPVSSFSVEAPFDVTRPIYNTGAEQGGYLGFTTGSNKRIAAQSSTASFSFIHDDRTYTVAAKVRFHNAAASAAEVLIDSRNGSSANVGISVLRNTSEQIVLAVSRGDGNVVHKITSTDTITDTDWHQVIVKCNGTTASLQIDEGTEKTAGAGTGGAVDASFDLHFGARSSSADLPALSDMAHVIVLNQEITAGDLSHWRTYTGRQPAYRLRWTLRGDPMHWSLLRRR